MEVCVPDGGLPLGEESSRRSGDVALLGSGGGGRQGGRGNGWREHVGLAEGWRRDFFLLNNARFNNDRRRAVAFLEQLQLGFGRWRGGKFGRGGRGRDLSPSSLFGSRRSFEMSVNSWLGDEIQRAAHSIGSTRRRFSFLLAGLLTRGALPPHQ